MTGAEIEYSRMFGFFPKAGDLNLTEAFALFLHLSKAMGNVQYKLKKLTMPRVSSCLFLSQGRETAAELLEISLGVEYLGSCPSSLCFLYCLFGIINSSGWGSVFCMVIRKKSR